MPLIGHETSCETPFANKIFLSYSRKLCFSQYEKKKTHTQTQYFQCIPPWLISADALDTTKYSQNCILESPSSQRWD